MRNSADTDEQLRAAGELAARCRDGDTGAFRALMESQQGYAYAVAFRLLYDEENARDVVQEAFIRVWNNIRRYRSDVRFTTWLYRIVVNLCYDRIKMDSRRNKVFSGRTGFPAQDDPAETSDPHREMELADLQKQVLAEAKKLPPREYLVFQLRDVQDFSVGEVASMTGMSAGSVKTHLCFARKKLRTVLGSLMTEPGV